MYDVIIVGAGPAGLSAATILGRCRRNVLLCDDGQYRNESAQALHGYLGRDGIHPSELRRIGREQLERYDVEYRAARVLDANLSNGGFAVTFDDGSTAECRKLLLATGVQDKIPEVEGFCTYFGRGVFQSPYCNGWEARDRRLVAYGSGKNAADLARSLKTWSADVVLCTDGAAGLKTADVDDLARLGIPVLTGKISRLEGSDTGLERILFGDGSDLPVAAIFLSTGSVPRSDLASRLGLAKHKDAGKTGNLFLAGDASKEAPLALIAAADGAAVAIAINATLQEDSLA